MKPGEQEFLELILDHLKLHLKRTLPRMASGILWPTEQALTQ